MEVMDPTYAYITAGVPASKDREVDPPAGQTIAYITAGLPAEPVGGEPPAFAGRTDRHTLCGLGV